MWPPSNRCSKDIEILDQGTIAVLAAIFVLAGIGVQLEELVA